MILCSFSCNITIMNLMFRNILFPCIWCNSKRNIFFTQLFSEAQRYIHNNADNFIIFFSNVIKIDCQIRFLFQFWFWTKKKNHCWVWDRSDHLYTRIMIWLLIVPVPFKVLIQANGHQKSELLTDYRWFIHYQFINHYNAFCTHCQKSFSRSWM